MLDEIETLQRVRGDVREKGLNALRQLIDEIDAGRFPGLYLVITGTPAFYDGPQGIRRLEPLAQRLHRLPHRRPVRQPACRPGPLPGFDPTRCWSRSAARSATSTSRRALAPNRVLALADDAYVAELAGAVAGALGGQVGVAPRMFLKKLVGDVLDRIDQFADFDPRRHYALTLAEAELTEMERNAAAQQRRRRPGGRRRAGPAERWARAAC